MYFYIFFNPVMMTFFQLQELQFWVADDDSLQVIALYHEHYIIGKKYNKVCSLN